MFNKFFHFFHKKEDAVKQSNRWIFGVMLGAGLFALLAAFILTLDKFEVLKNPEVALSCSVNAVIDCSKVMQTWQSSVFGFPNMVIGLMAYSVVVTVAVMGLFNVKFPRPILLLAEIGFLLGTIFAYWLFFQSLYVIQVLCPWCLLVTSMTTLILASMTYFNLRENTLNLKKKTNERVQAFLKKGYYQLIIASWFVLMIALVFLKFGDALFA